jgi:hypothetical protein
MARVVILVLKLLSPVLAWAGVQVFGRLPAWPFLALTPARSAMGRSLSVALLLAGLLGLIALISLSSGTWVLIVAMIVAAGVVIGCGRAFATMWWPAAMAGALLTMGIALATLPKLSPWALTIDGQSEQAPILTVGGFSLVILAFVSSAMSISALRQLASRSQSPDESRPVNELRNHDAPKRRRRSRRGRGRR